MKNFRYQFGQKFACGDGEEIKLHARKQHISELLQKFILEAQPFEKAQLFYMETYLL